MTSSPSQCRPPPRRQLWEPTDFAKLWAMLAEVADQDKKREFALRNFELEAEDQAADEPAGLHIESKEVEH